MYLHRVECTHEKQKILYPSIQQLNAKTKLPIIVVFDITLHIHYRRHIFGLITIITYKYAVGVTLLFALVCYKLIIILL